ncbi:MAG: DNA primase [Clostridia bacterium]|nr:DNA primase [Clostridia bacterium]
MASRYPSAWLDELRSRSDLVQTVSGYVALKKNGRRWWGLCPFHGEKTASFSVDEEAQLYYCFGCKAGGNVITFLMEMDHLTFNEAVEQLAERAHMPLPQMIQDEDYERRRTQRERLLNANREAARFFHETLFTPAGAASLDYLRKRGLSDGVIRKFGLGAAPEGWDTLTKHLLEKGFSLEELQLAGLTVIKEAVPATADAPARPRRAFDMFRNRAIFPIIDAYGNVLAFGGRILGKGEPKYLNTSDTPVFNKRKGVFAANLLRKERHLDRVILVEGYMDVVSLTQFGVKGVCATLGTALTNEQARLLKRYAPQVFLSYDGDAAGQHAILRGLDILKEEGVPARVLDFPDGLDPDEFIRRDGPEGFAKLKSVTPETYRIRRLKDSLDLSGQEGKVSFARQAVAIVAPLEPVEREGYLKEIMIQTGFSRDVLQAQLAEELQKLGRAVPKPPARRRVDPAEAVGVVPTGETEGREAAGAGRKKLSEAEWKVLRAQEMLLGLLATGRLPEDLAQEEDFEDPELKLIYQDLKRGEKPSSLVDRAPDGESRSRLTRLLLSPAAGSTDELMAMAHDCVARIRHGRYEKKLKEIEARLTNCNDEAEQLGLLAEYQSVSDALRKME